MADLRERLNYFMLVLTVIIMPKSNAGVLEKRGLVSAGGGVSSDATKTGTLKWAWLHGETIGNQHTNEAEILFSDEQPSQQASQKHGFFYPGSRAGTTSWQVTDGTFWMFGGQGFDDKPTNEPRLLNDLWEFDTRKQTWNLIDDVDPSNTKEDSNNKGPIPKPRKLAASCGVQGLMFVTYGGEDEAGNVLNDTWVYDIKESEWLILEYSLQFQPPPGRKDMAYWCSRDKLLIYGGVNSSGETVNDMWEFSLRTLHWQNIDLQPDDVPTGRAGSLTWVASGGLLYLYGGFSIDELGSFTGLNDLWQFNHFNQSWNAVDTCVNNNLTSGVGNNSATQPPLIGIRGKVRDCPGARRHGATWVEQSKGNLWLFGGEILPCSRISSSSMTSAPVSDVYSSLYFMADLWRFDILHREWTWMGMAKTPGMTARYGTNYEPSTKNHPGARCQMVTWTRKGQMFLYGGLGLDARNKTAFLNDVWIMTHSSVTYSFMVDRDWFRSIPPSTVFFVTLGSFGGVVLAFGVGFYLKKMLESPNHNPSEFRVKYTRVRQDTFFDY